MSSTGPQDTVSMSVLSGALTPRRVQIVRQDSHMDSPAESMAPEGVGGASLRDLHRMGLPIPPGFEVTPAAYREFMETRRLFEVAEGVLAAADPTDQGAMARATAQVRRIMMNANMPGQLHMRIRAAYESLGQGPVMVRVSGPADGADSAPRAEEQTEFRNVHGIGQLFHAIRACWAACFDPARMAHRLRDHQPEQAGLPVLSVQRMLSADVSGLLYTLDPFGPRKDVVRVEAVYGLSDPLLEGRFAPDVYYLDRSTQRILASTVSPQMRLLQIRKSGKARAWTTVYAPVMSGQNKRKLTDSQAQSLARMALRLERQYGHPQTVEWALVDGQAYILQAWPTDQKKLAPSPAPVWPPAQAAGV